MDDPTQVPPDDFTWDRTPDAPFDAGTPEPPDPGIERAVRGLWIWFAIVGLALVASVGLAEGELGLLAATGGLFAVAHAVDRVPRLRLLHHFLAGLVSLGGALLCIGIARFLQDSPLPALERHVGLAISVVAAIVSAAMWYQPFADALVRILFRETVSTQVTRLAARMVTLALLASGPLWVTFRAMLALDMLNDMDLGSSSVWGSLIGLTLLSLGGVGAFVVRTPREAIARLGLGPLRTRDLLWIPIGVLILAGLNSGIEWVQKAWFPTQWAFDQKVVTLMAGHLSQVETVLLGVSAGFGEELSMRGALQPRLGLALTALLFAALHVQYSWTGMATIVVFGLALGLARMRSSTTTAIAIHAIYDIIAALGAQQTH